MTEAVKPAIAPLPRDEIAALSGLDILRGMIAGALPAPPFAATTRIHPVLVDEGYVVFEGEPSVDFLNPLGTVHGGWLATLLDSAMACAVHSRLAPGQIYTTLEMKVNFVRAVTPKIARA
jgi:acyl-coenzyme A thioesterase PaaI-like protein